VTNPSSSSASLIAFCLAGAMGDTVAFGRALSLLARLAIIVCVFSLC
jgi:hypothetical protein